jgi:hypothetical protein
MKTAYSWLPPYLPQRLSEPWQLLLLGEGELSPVKSRTSLATSPRNPKQQGDLIEVHCMCQAFRYPLLTTGLKMSLTSYSTISLCTRFWRFTYRPTSVTCFWTQPSHPCRAGVRKMSTNTPRCSQASSPRVAVLYQAVEPPIVNGVRKPKKPGGRFSQ